MGVNKFYVVKGKGMDMLKNIKSILLVVLIVVSAGSVCAERWMSVGFVVFSAPGMLHAFSPRGGIGCGERGRRDGQEERANGRTFVYNAEHNVWEHKLASLGGDRDELNSLLTTIVSFDLDDERSVSRAKSIISDTYKQLHPLLEAERRWLGEVEVAEGSSVFDCSQPLSELNGRRWGSYCLLYRGLPFEEGGRWTSLKKSKDAAALGF